MNSHEGRYKVQGKVAVITGGSRGLGLSIATELVDRGAKIVIGDILDSVGKEAVDMLRKGANAPVALYKHTDVTKYDDLIALFGLAEKAFGGVDIAILNAGTIANAAALVAPLDDDLEMKNHDINVGGVIKGTKVAVMHMVKRGGGVIVNTASSSGFWAMYGIESYAASKHAVIGWTRSLSTLKGLCNIRVNAVCPHYVDTDMTRGPKDGSDESAFRKIQEANPRTEMKTVVEAFMSCITDDRLSGAALLALPDGIHKQSRPIPPKTIYTEESLKVAQKYLPIAEEQAREALRKASMKFFESKM